MALVCLASVAAFLLPAMNVPLAPASKTPGPASGAASDPGRSLREVRCESEGWQRAQPRTRCG